MAANPTPNLKDLIDEFDREVGTAVASNFAWKTLRNLAATEPAILTALNRNARSWLIIQHSLQVTMIIALGRIFDRAKGTFTVHRFLRECKNNVGEFSATSYERRCLANNYGVRPDYLDTYLQTFYSARASDFDALEAEVEPYAARFEAIYKPIRDKLMAHREAQSINQADQLFSTTDISEVDRMLVFLNGVWAVVREFYLNRRKTKVSEHRLERGGAAAADIESLLRKLATG